MTSSLDIYFSALVRAAEAAAGRLVDGATVIAPEAGRAGTGSATSYPTPSGTIVWCDPALVEMLAELLGVAADSAVDSDEFVRLTMTAGATLSGFGRNRILDGELRRPSIGTATAGVSALRLEGNDPADLTLLAEFADAASKDDLDEADLDLDELDPFIVGLFDGDLLVGYGSGRPSAIDERFDDIGVLTHPDHRRRGLGVLAVAEFVERRTAASPERHMLYRCRAENAGSNAIAEALGFTLAHTIGAVRFPATSVG